MWYTDSFLWLVIGMWLLAVFGIYNFAWSRGARFALREVAKAFEADIRNRERKQP